MPERSVAFRCISSRIQLRSSCLRSADQRKQSQGLSIVAELASARNGDRETGAACLLS
jgi:hypothetical protein